MSEEQAPSPAVEPTPSEPIAENTPPVVAENAPPAPAAEPVEKASDWPEDWRQKYSDDPKMIKRLERYASPKAALDALFAAQAKVAEKGTRLKADASPEEVSAWRADNGIPDSPEGYEVELSEGRVWGEADKPIVDDFLKQAHEANMHPSQVNKALDWYMGQQERMQVDTEARDIELRESALDNLRAEYGQDFRRNLKVAKEIIPEDFRDAFLGGRMADGTLVGDNPNVIRWLVAQARELNPIGTVMPGSGTNAVQAMETELNNLKSMMADRKSEYWKGPKSAQLQGRYRELLTARDRAKG